MTENQHVCARKFEFFRVVLLDFSTKLTIPQRLTNYFIKENLTLVTLLSPLGKSWNVRIGGDSKGLHFAEGWERFAAAHGLSFGDFLVFKYIGSVVFKVTIFDKSTCEKNYQVMNGIAGDDAPVGQGENGEKESECFKKQTTPSSAERTPTMEQESNEGQPESSACRRKALPKPVHGKAKEGTKQGGERGSHFEITISPRCKHEVNIPIKFARSNDLSSVHQMLLRDPSGRGPWPVNLLHYKRSNGHDQYTLSAGWRDFRVHNNLKDGDVCVFQLKKKNEMLVQIHWSYGGANTNQDENGSRRSKSRLQQVVQLKRAAPVQPKGSPSKVTRTCKLVDSVQFESIIVPSNVRKGGYMTIPKAFLSSVDLSAVKEAILVDPNYRRWPVKIHQDCKKRCRTGHHGWAAFCVENDVEIGDVCVFNFKYRGREATFQVEVIKSKAAGGKL